ncbi:hypothetical protein ACFFJY_03835 [Fictibacillus aquaticus]|uniref:Uncharacterized protein n=1 Tax=Fictibacillus aquaticus TaxID=2021314 RepID=A0A235F555_9BACL|nr:hypothetical protein [Fictibacillus aquaticus]OYD56057.1 hypothetical protein CGZ90_19545 [Fictibacillus aquaticus]
MKSNLIQGIIFSFLIHILFAAGWYLNLYSKLKVNKENDYDLQNTYSFGYLYFGPFQDNVKLDAAFATSISFVFMLFLFIIVKHCVMKWIRFKPK